MLVRQSCSWILVALLSVGSLSAAAPEMPLIEAAKRADLQSLRALLPTSDVNATEPDGTTALHWAVHGDDREAVDVLIRAGANVNAVNRYGVAPISLATLNGSAPILESLLEAGANANAALEGGETALMTAGRTGKIDAIKVLLAHGADVNAREATNGQTVLMWAAAENNGDAIRTLLEAGAELNTRTGLQGGAAKPASLGVFSQATGAGATDGSDPSFTAFLFAVQRGHIEAARTLLAAGADPNETLPDGTSALVIAAMNGNWELGAFLLEKGADPNADRQGWTALHQIARSRRTNIGWLPAPPGKGNISSLDLVEKLLQDGADVNARMARDFRDGYRNRMNRVGATPFLLSAKSVDTEMMRTLLTYGADPLAGNADDSTPIMVAAGVDIWNPGEDGGTGPGSEPEAYDAVNMLIDLGADLHAANAYGETALHGAAYRGANTIVQLLVDSGAKLDARNTEGWTPWTIANGVWYSLFYKEQPDTANFIQRLMADRGVSVEGMRAGEVTPDTLKCRGCARSGFAASAVNTTTQVPLKKVTNTPAPSTGGAVLPSTGGAPPPDESTSPTTRKEDGQK